MDETSAARLTTLLDLQIKQRPSLGEQFGYSLKDHARRRGIQTSGRTTRSPRCAASTDVRSGSGTYAHIVPPREASAASLRQHGKTLRRARKTPEGILEPNESLLQ